MRQVFWGKRLSGTNERDLSPGRDDKLGARQKLAMYPPRLQPQPGTTLKEVIPVDRVAGMDEYLRAETAENARRRLSSKHD